MPLTDVQWVLGHAHLSTTQRYLNPVTEDVIAGVLAFHARQRDRGAGCAAGGGIPGREPADPVRRGRDRDRRRQPAGDHARRPPVLRSRRRGLAKATGAQLLAAFPPRPVASSWPATAGEPVRRCWPGCSPPPFALDNPVSQQTRRLGVLAVLNWLQTHPGDSWQQRWQASGAEDQPDWRDLITDVAAGRRGQDGPPDTAAAPEPGAAGADLRRRDPAQPGLAAALRPGAPRPGRRDGPHPRRRRVRRARRVVRGRAGSGCRPGSRR